MSVEMILSNFVVTTCEEQRCTWVPSSPASWWVVILISLPLGQAELPVDRHRNPVPACSELNQVLPPATGNRCVSVGTCVVN